MNTQSPQQTPAPAATSPGPPAGPVPQPRVPAAAGAVGSPVQRCSICGKTQAMGAGSQSMPGVGFNAGFGGGFGGAPGGGFNPAGGGCFCGPPAGMAPGFPMQGGGGFSAGVNLGMPGVQMPSVQMPGVQMPGFGFNVQGPAFAAPQIGFQGQLPMMQQQPMMMGGGGGGMGMPAPMPQPMPMPSMGGGMQMGGTFNPYNPNANAYADAYAAVRQRTWGKAMRWALGGTLTGSLLVMGMFFFVQWWNGGTLIPGTSENSSQVQTPTNPGTTPTPPANSNNNFSWVNPSGAPFPAAQPQVPRTNIHASQQSQQFPGLPISYLRGGFGWFVAKDQRIVYVAHDADMNAQVSARAFVQDRGLNGELWRIIVVGANAPGTEPARPPTGSGGAPAADGSTSLSSTERRKLLELLLDARRRTEAIRSQLRGEGQLRYHLTPRHHAQLDPDLDGSVSSIDEAIGMLRGEDK